jgi:hypothetical protein
MKKRKKERGVRDSKLYTIVRALRALRRYKHANPVGKKMGFCLDFQKVNRK